MLKEKAFMVEDYAKRSAIYAMLNRLHLGDFKWDMSRNSPKMLITMIEKAQKHVMERDSWKGKCEGVTPTKKANKRGRPFWPSYKSAFD